MEDNVVVVNFAFGFPTCLLGQATSSLSCFKDACVCEHVEVSSPDATSAMKESMLAFLSSMKQKGYTVQWTGPYGLDEGMKYVSDRNERVGDCRERLQGVGVDAFDPEDAYFSNQKRAEVDVATLRRAEEAVRGWGGGKKRCLVVSLFGCADATECRPDEPCERQMPTCPTISVGAWSTKQAVQAELERRGCPCAAAAAAEREWRQKHASKAEYEEGSFQAVAEMCWSQLRRLDEEVRKLLCCGARSMLTSTAPMDLSRVGGRGEYSPGCTRSFAALRLPSLPGTRLACPVSMCDALRFLEGELPIDEESTYGNAVSKYLRLENSGLFAHSSQSNGLQFNAMYVRSVVSVDSSSYEMTVYFSLEALACVTLDESDFREWLSQPTQSKLQVFESSREWNNPATRMQTFEECMQSGMEVSVYMTDDYSRNLASDAGWLAGHESFLVLQEFATTMEKQAPSLVLVSRPTVEKWDAERAAAVASVPTINEDLLAGIDVDSLPSASIMTIVQSTPPIFLPGIVHPDVLFSLAKAGCIVRSIDGSMLRIHIHSTEVTISNVVVNIRSFQTCSFLGRQFACYSMTRVLREQPRVPLLLTQAYRDDDSVSTSSRGSSSVPHHRSVRTAEKMRNMRMNY